MRHVRRLCLAALALATLACGPPPPATDRKLIVLAVEGLDPELTERLIQSGRAPHLAELARGRGLVRVTSTPGADATSAWASFATGTNPGKHGLFDLVMPDALTGRPSAKLLTRKASARFPGGWWSEGAAYQTVRVGDPFWTRLGRADIRSAVLFVPGTFPPEPIPLGTSIAGTPLPDWAGGMGSGYTWLASDVAPGQVGPTRYGGRVERLAFSRNVAYATLVGIREPERVDLPLTITWNPEARSANIEVGGASVYLAEGQQSRWIAVSVRLNLLTRVRGLLRLHLVKAGNDVQLYVSPIQWHPDQPPSATSYPADAASALFDRLGEYRTLAWPEASWAVADGYLPEAQFLAAQDETFTDRAAALMNRVESGDWDLIVAGVECLDTTARLMWRTLDPGHAAYDPAVTARFGGAIERAYVKLDELVGQLRARLPADADVALVSTYGVYTARHLVDLNRWLTDEGLLKWTAPPAAVTLASLADATLWADSVDWAHTSARAMGAGRIYLNVRGRDPRGVVAPGAAYEALVAHLRERLETLTDPMSGRRVVARVRTADEAYAGPLAAQGPDLVITFSPGYRASFDSMLGGMAAAAIAPNTERWSAEHASVDEGTVPGVWLSTIPLSSDVISVMDVGPTVLQYFGRPVPPGSDGVSRLADRGLARSTRF
jgi:predicted AlkP superfamily phosphohydrolase/phosphomutase